jgi:hypothetical protein
MNEYLFYERALMRQTPPLPTSMQLLQQHHLLQNKTLRKHTHTHTHTYTVTKEKHPTLQTLNPQILQKTKFK